MRVELPRPSNNVRPFTPAPEEACQRASCRASPPTEGSCAAAFPQATLDDSRDLIGFDHRRGSIHRRGSEDGCAEEDCAGGAEEGGSGASD